MYEPKSEKEKIRNRTKYGVKMVQRTILLRPEEMEKIQKIADASELTVNDVIRWWIRKLPDDFKLELTSAGGDHV